MQEEGVVGRCRRRRLTAPRHAVFCVNVGQNESNSKYNLCVECLLFETGSLLAAATASLLAAATAIGNSEVEQEQEVSILQPLNLSDAI